MVVDTNIVFSALLRAETSFARLILGSGRPLFINESVLVELFRHKERIVALSKLPATDVVRLHYILMRRLSIAKEDLIEPAHRQRAYELCADIDPADAPQVALVLQLDGLLWTGDKKLRTGLSAKGFDAFFDPRIF